MKAIKDGDMEKVVDWIGQVKAGRDDVSSFIDIRKETYTVGDSEISSRGMTALHYAAFYSQAEIVQVLLDASAGKPLTSVVENFTGEITDTTDTLLSQDY